MPAAWRKRMSTGVHSGRDDQRDFRQNVIGSFGMGAKKGIFRLTDGAKIISCPRKEFPALVRCLRSGSTAPLGDLDGRAKPTEKERRRSTSSTVPPPDSRGARRVDSSGPVPFTLLCYRSKLRVGRSQTSQRAFPNGWKRPRRGVNWSEPEGGRAAMYKFSHIFEDFLATGNNIELTSCSAAGCATIPGKREGSGA